MSPVRAGGGRGERRPAGRRIVALLALVVSLPACGSTAESGADGHVGGITIAAASDLRFAFTEIGDRFTADTGVEVTFSFGSSGLLHTQILNGAPFDLFASADERYVDVVIAEGPGRVETRSLYALGRIVVWTPPGTAPPASVAELADPRYRRIAMANPEHAPYGVAAEQALRSAGVLDAVRDRLILGENIADTLRIVESGNADAGLVALSLAVTSDRDHVLVPAELHEPLRQALVVTSTGARGEAAEAFADAVASPEGIEIMARYGFVVPDADPGRP